MTLDVRIHGRGGQGVVTAAELLSLAAFAQGRHAQALPSFGSERTGAPVLAYCRISDEPIRAHDPVSEPQVVVVQDPTLSLSTVYRTMKVLESQGAIERHAFEDGISRYEHAHQEHHDHLIDIETGAVIEFSSDAIEELQRRIAAELGYELVRHRLELYGRKKQPARKGRK